MISWLEKNNYISWTLTILIAITIFYISSLTFQIASGPPGKFDIKPTLYHITAFFFLALLLQISLVKKKNINLFLPAILISILYGILDEIHQIFVPGRFGSINDILLNSLGIFYAFMFYSITIQYRRLNNKNV